MRRGGESRPQELELRVTGERGTATFTAAGKATYALAARTEARTRFPQGEWSVRREGHRTETTTFAVAGRDVVIEGGEGEPLTVTPLLGGDVLVGREVRGGDQLDSPAVQFLLFVRWSSGASVADLGGPLLFAGFDAATEDRGPASAQGYRLASESLAGTLDGRGGVTLGGTAEVETHDPTTGDQVNTIEVVPTFDGRYSVASNGAFDTGEPGAAGALAPTKDLLVRVLFDGENFALGFGLRAAGQAVPKGRR